MQKNQTNLFAKQYDLFPNNNNNRYYNKILLNNLGEILLQVEFYKQNPYY